MANYPFSAQASSISISVNASASTSTALPGTGSVLRVVNEGPYTAFISVGSTSQTATVPSASAVATCTPVIPGDATFTIPSGTALNISAICRANQSATLTVQVGEGF